MITSQENDKVCAAFVKAQSQFKSVPKTAVNPHFRSKYASLDDILAMAVPVLNANGLSLMQSVDGETISTTVFHESGQWISSGPMKLLIDKQNMQGMGSAITYGRRYSVASTLGIDSDEDDDGNGASNPPAARKPVAASASTPAAEAKKPTTGYDEKLNQSCEKWQDWKTPKGNTLGSIVEFNAPIEKKEAGLNTILSGLSAILDKVSSTAEAEIVERDIGFVKQAISALNKPF